MGLFSFLRGAGRKVEEPATPAPNPDEVRRAREQGLRNLIASYGINVKDLFILVNGEKVTVSGEVDSQSDREKVVLILGNVQGVATVDDNLRVEKPAPQATFYEVKKGDSLSKIAKALYGDAMKYPVIFEANKPMLKDPNLIYPGQVLRIPPQ